VTGSSAAVTAEATVTVVMVMASICDPFVLSKSYPDRLRSSPHWLKVI
jgi:hypothetical protein